MLHDAQHIATDSFFKSINVRLDVAHPERFSHFHPTKNSISIIRAVLLGEPSASSMIVAAYGSGKSLAAGAAAVFLENRSDLEDLLLKSACRIGDVDEELGEVLTNRINDGRKGLPLVLEGYEPDAADGIFLQAKKRLGSLRRPRNHKSDPLSMLEAVWKRAKKQNFDRIAIVWDEFGRHLETLADESKTRELLFVQQISEWAARKKFPSVTLGLILHQNFLHYADNLSQTARNGWKKIEGRFETIHYVEDSCEIYELIASVISNLPVEEVVSTSTPPLGNLKNRRNGLSSSVCSARLKPVARWQKF